MSNKTKIILVIVIVVLLIIGYKEYTKSGNLIAAVGGQLIEDNIPYFRNNGGMNTALPVTITGGTTIGSTGTNVSNLSIGTCFIAPYAATITGTTTVAVDCQGTRDWNANGTSALTGIGVNDALQLQLSTTTASVTNTRGIDIIGASASTTAGHIQLLIANLSGATFTWPTTAGTASGTATFISSR